MPTKYELQAELRELNRGFPRIPISKLKMHELEAHIDAVKKIKSETAAILPTKTPSLPGPKGPRVIAVEEEDTGIVTIKTPKVPPTKVIPVPKGKKAGSATTEEGPASPLPKMPSVPSKKAKSVGHHCNCPFCPLQHS
jgi:hypothetical protein